MFVAKRSHLKPTPHRVSQDEFDSIVRAHEIFSSGRQGGGRTIPRFIVGHGMRCDRRRLMDADFNAADLSRSSFIETDLTRASFYCATLIQCDFRRATLRHADLRGAALAGAKLAGANLDEAEIRAAVLIGRDDDQAMETGLIGARADLRGSSLDSAHLEGLVAQGVDFSNCSLRGAKLRNADLRIAALSGANREGADLEGAQLASIKLHGAILSSIELSSLDLSPESLIDCVTDPTIAALARAAEIREAIAQTELWVETHGAQGVLSRLDSADIRVVGDAFKSRALTGLSAAKVNGIAVDFSGAQLQGAIFDGADLRRAHFQGADLRGAMFAGANLAHADFVGAAINPLTLPSGRTLQTLRLCEPGGHHIARGFGSDRRGPLASPRRAVQRRPALIFSSAAEPGVSAAPFSSFNGVATVSSASWRSQASGST